MDCADFPAAPKDAQGLRAHSYRASGRAGASLAPGDWMVEAIWRCFSSLKVAAANAVALAAAIAAGVILDRREIFQSWWFTLAVLIMALCVIACSLERGRLAWWPVSASVLVILAGGLAGSFIDYQGTVVIPQ